METCVNKTCESTARSKYASLMACGSCGIARYCCRECQKADWKARHKIQCFGSKFAAISQALEICLLGINSGGKPGEQLARVRTILEQTDAALSSPDGTSDQEHLHNLLIAVYVPPIVQISERSFAVFSPGVFHGVYPTRDTALQVVTQQYIAFGSGQVTTICGPHEYMHPLVANGGIPRMNWTEHALIAVYLGMYDAPKQAVQDMELNKSVSLPRAEIPNGIQLPVLSADKTRVLVQAHDDQKKGRLH